MIWTQVPSRGLAWEAKRLTQPGGLARLRQLTDRGRWSSGISFFLLAYYRPHRKLLLGRGTFGVTGAWSSLALQPHGCSTAPPPWAGIAPAAGISPAEQSILEPPMRPGAPGSPPPGRDRRWEGGEGREEGSRTDHEESGAAGRPRTDMPTGCPEAMRASPQSTVLVCLRR